MDEIARLHAMLSNSFEDVSEYKHKKLATKAEDLASGIPFLAPSQSNADVFQFFTQHAAFENVAVVENGKPIGLINKNIFMEAYVKPFAREIFARHSCIAWMNKDPLVVEADMPVERLTRLAVEKGESVLKDGFITVQEGMYTGIGTGFSLMQAMSDLESEKTRQLLEGIEYASAIQQAHLRTSKQHLVSAFQDQFMLWEPRDVVGGDCYFVRRYAQGVLVVLIDCTGHGVPGAFMTLVALSWLEQNTAQFDQAPSPADIIGGLNTYVKGVLDQRADLKKRSVFETGSTRSDDGMDAAALWLPIQSSTFVFSASRLCLMLCEAGASEGRLIEGDKAGVGYSETPDNFCWTNHIVEASHGTRALIPTDGVIDQIGGPKGLALGKKRLMKFLVDNASRPSSEIGRSLRTFITEWQGEESRRDDVTAFAFTTGGQQ